MKASLAFALVLVAVAPGCRCKGDTKVGDKRAFACAEVPTKDDKADVDLGGGAKLVRVGVRAELTGVPDGPIAITSLQGVGEGGVGPTAPPAGVAAAIVVGLGGLPRAGLAAALSSFAKAAPLVVVASGPQDEVDVVRAAIGDAGPRVVDGGLVRALSVAGVEAVTLPGSDDPSTLPDHGRGCVLRVEDVKALAAKLGPATAGRPRLAVAFAAPSRDEQRPGALDGLADVAAWAIAGPLDADADPDLTLAPGARAPLVPVPRATGARTTSVPAVVPAGWLLARAQEGALRLYREAVDPDPPAPAPSGSTASP